MDNPAFEGVPISRAYGAVLENRYFLSRLIDHEQFGECPEIEEPLDLPRQTAQRQRAVRFFSEPNQKRAKPGAADVDEMLEVNDNATSTGFGQSGQPFAERLRGIAIDPTLDPRRS